MEYFQIISGLILLTLGRKLFWLCIALIGFFVGMELSGLFLFNQPSWLMFLVGILAGVLGAFIAVFAQRAAFVIAGFFAGGYIVFVTAQIYRAYSAPELFFIAGGIAGALLSALFMDWAIIILSCFAGAAMVLDMLALGKMPELIVFFMLVSGGVVIQRWQMKGGGVGSRERG